MNSSKVSKKSLTIDSALASFIENDVLEGLDIYPNKFWSNFEQFLKEYSLLANQFLKIRDDIQSQIDQWHIGHKGHPHDQEEYESFLVDIG
ncbi:MAG: malate synthase G, partial [Actinomycetota bacterium]|nr:malate synthase G [Actinomycetota bacterium]